MAASRRPANMSDFLASLNAPPSAQDSNDFEDVSLFTNTDFFDFNFTNEHNNPATNTLSPSTVQTESSPTAHNMAWNGQHNPDFLNGEFNYGQQFNSINAVPQNINLNYNQHNAAARKQSNASVSNNVVAGIKRKALDIHDPTLPLEERTRVAAEEDKRRRNTAASARFRVKKKQREQALEKTAKDMDEKASRLEKRVNELEMENRWLKGLITEKTGGEKMNDMWTKFLADGGEKTLQALDAKVPRS